MRKTVSKRTNDSVIVYDWKCVENGECVFFLIGPIHWLNYQQYTTRTSIAHSVINRNFDWRHRFQNVNSWQSEPKVNQQCKLKCITFFSLLRPKATFQSMILCPVELTNRWIVCVFVVRLKNWFYIFMFWWCGLRLFWIQYDRKCDGKPSFDSWTLWYQDYCKIVRIRLDALHSI